MTKTTSQTIPTMIVYTLLNAILILSLVVVSLFPFDYLHEVLRITKNQYEAISSLVIVLFIILFSVIDLTKRFNKKKFTFIVLGLLLLIVVGNNFYRSRKQERMSRLRILQILPHKGIQAQLVTVNGLYFGNNGLVGGQVILDGEPVYKILSWTDNTIVFEQPVPIGIRPTRFGWVDLYIIGNDGRQSNVVQYEILDPDIYL